MTDTSTTIRAEIQIKAAVPTFLVPDVAGTARWYSEHLGFRTAGTFPKQEPSDRHLSFTHSQCVPHPDDTPSL